MFLASANPFPVGSIWDMRIGYDNCFPYDVDTSTFVVEQVDREHVLSSRIKVINIFNVG